MLVCAAAPVWAASAPEVEEGVEGVASEARLGDHSDFIPDADSTRRALLREQALKEKLAGRAQGRVHEVAKGQFVELSLERNDRVFVILAEFGDQIHPTYGGSPGPLHNSIAQPNRQTDNSTIWQADYSSAHYRDLYFSSAPGADSMVNFFRSQSSGRYTINGQVTEWVKVPYNEARYGNNRCGSTVCSTVWLLVNDAIDRWTADQLASGKTPAEVSAYLATFDQWDRNDYDHDGNFDEPDGYIDHFQIVHAGVGEETGGGAQGTNAIWSHRWSVGNIGDGAGPAYNPRTGARFGGLNMWVRDYTIQPENGGLGVFAHEYTHDLGIPDQYDTSNAADNGTGFWTLMSAGSYLGDGTVDIGSRPGDLFAWDKFQLGWLNYETAEAGVRSTHKLGPAEANTKKAQAVVVTLPPKAGTPIPTTPAFAGSYSWFGGRGNNVDSRMTRTLALPAAASIQLQLMTAYDIEEDWDYAYVSVSTDGGATFANLPSSITRNTNPNAQNFGNGITGTSPGWVPATFDLTPYAGRTVQLRLRYWTDGAAVQNGFQVDALAVVADGATVFSDGAETSPNGWTLAGFGQAGSTFTPTTAHYYFAEFRQYRDYDASLQTGPYNFGFSAAGLPNYVEHYPYQDGLLISYWDLSQSNNNVSSHPGQGRILPVDAHPQPLLRANGVPWSGRVQNYDAPFGLEATDPISLNTNGVGRSDFPSLPAVPTFDDRQDYWFPSAPYAGTKVPRTGTVIEVINTSAQGSFMQVRVRPAS
ncbi:M6 family metalloprotease domain-containing protein [Aggregicoccus sp. 17bor-14]|nr:M6 family metalloprotease domain-containing protein [Aggregicoccus sp. 17bor-14]